MELTIEVVAFGDAAPPAGAPVIVQIRDAGYQDESSTTVAETRANANAGEVLARVSLQCEPSTSAIVWVHVDVDESGDVSKGDYITMRSYPVGEGGAMRVEVRRV